MPDQPNKSTPPTDLRPKWVAILTGAISLLLGIGYLVLVQLLDFRGDLQPAPMVEPQGFNLPRIIFSELTIGLIHLSGWIAEWVL
jgi:hypothetical protein